jgi:uncharacterized membrane protein
VTEADEKDRPSAAVERAPKIEIASEALPPQLRDRLARGDVEIVVTYEGPIPPPQMLKGFAEVDSSFPARIFAMAEQQAKHQQEMERNESTLNKRAFDEQVTVLKRGQTFAITTVLASIGTAGVLGYLGHEFAASVLAAVGLSEVVAAFLFRQQVGKSTPQAEQQRSE